MPITLETKFTTRPKKDLGVASPKATERVFLAYPLRPSLRSDTSPKGGGKGAV